MILCAALVVVLAAGIFCIFVREAWFWTAYSGVLLALGVAAAARAFRRESPFEWDFPLAALCVLPAAGVVQLIFGLTADPAATWSGVVQWLALTVLFAGSRSLFTDPNIRHLFLSATAWFAAAVALLSLVQYLSSNGRIYWLIPTDLERVLGPFRNRNHYACFIELTLPVLLVRAIHMRERAFEYGVLASLVGVSVIAGASRAGSALIAVETVVLLILLWRRGHLGMRSLGRGLGAAAFAFGLFFAIGGADGLVDRLSLSQPGDPRKHLYASTVEMIHARPALGFGLGSYEFAYPAYARFDTGQVVDHAHSDWLEWAAETGVATVLPLAALTLWAAWMARREVWAVGVVVIMLHAGLDYPLHKPALAAWWVVMLAALAATRWTRSGWNEPTTSAYN